MTVVGHRDDHDVAAAAASALPVPGRRPPWPRRARRRSRPRDPASRLPITVGMPAVAQRRTRPRPCGPVPPRTATVIASREAIRSWSGGSSGTSERGSGRAGPGSASRTSPSRTDAPTAREPEEAELPDLHPGVELDRERGHVRQLERHVPGEAGVDEAGGRVGEQAEPAERRLALDAGRDVVRQGAHLVRRAQHELPGCRMDGSSPSGSTIRVRSDWSAAGSMWG